MPERRLTPARGSTPALNVVGVRIMAARSCTHPLSCSPTPEGTILAPPNLEVFGTTCPRLAGGFLNYNRPRPVEVRMSTTAPTERSAPDPAQRLAAIVESSDDAIVSKDLTGVITSWNRGAEQLFGYTAAEAIGQSITMLIPPDRLSEEDHVLGRIRRGERVEHFETTRRRKDGTSVDVSLTVSPILDSSGAIVGASKIARDITVRKRLEEGLRDMQARLLALAKASASILGSPGTDAVLAATMALARDVFDVDGYAVWRYDPSGAWKVLRSSGISEMFAARMSATDAGRSVPSQVAFGAPLIFEDVATAPMLAEMTEAYRAEGIISMVVFPLAIRGEDSATMVF
jgi:PAS domain S-box-containing protein